MIEITKWNTKIKTAKQKLVPSHVGTRRTNGVLIPCIFRDVSGEGEGRGCRAVYAEGATHVKHTSSAAYSQGARNNSMTSGIKRGLCNAIPCTGHAVGSTLRPHATAH